MPHASREDVFRPQLEEIMLKRLIAGFFCALCFAGPAIAQTTCGNYTYNLTNGTTADASQVMSNFNQVKTCVNALSSGGTLNNTTLSGTTTLPTLSGTTTATGTFSVSRSVSGGLNDFKVANEATAASSDVRLLLQTAGTSAGSATLAFYDSGGANYSGLRFQSGSANIQVTNGFGVSPTVIATFTPNAGTAIANQLRSTQALAPSCQGTTCGTSPSFVGSDTAMIVTMGSTGVPANPFVINFRATWAAAPSCIGQMAKGGMAIGKMPLTLAATSTQLTVTTNGTAPGNSDVYSIHCIGVQ
jgi:hypothetical protein